MIQKISKIAHFAGHQYDANGFPARWFAETISVMRTGEKYLVKFESYLGTGSVYNKIESESVFDSADEVNKALHAEKEYADYYRQAYKD